MKNPWARREILSTVVAAAFAALFLRSAIAEVDAVSALWHLGVALSFVSIALSPQVLFERITMDRLKIHGPVLVGGSALCGVVSTACYTLAAILAVADR